MHVVSVDLHDLTVYMSNMAGVFQEARTDYSSQSPGTYPPPGRFFVVGMVRVALSLSLSVILCVSCVQHCLCPLLSILGCPFGFLSHLFPFNIPMVINYNSLEAIRPCMVSVSNSK